MKVKAKKLLTFRNVGILIVIAIIIFVVTQLTGANGKNGVASVKIEKGEVTEELVLSGTIRAQSAAVLNFPASSTMAEILVAEGDLVTKGQRLGRIDTTSLNASLMQAQSALRDAQATVDRVHDDLKGKDKTETFTEKETRTTAEVAKDNAYENLIKAQKALRDAVFYAPIAGIITNVGIETIGASTTISSPAFEIVDPDSIYLSVEADQTEVGGVRVGDRAKIVLDAFEDEELEGVVSAVSFASVTGETGSVYPVRIKLDTSNSNYKYKVGMTADAHFVTNKASDVLFVPPKYVKSDKQGKYVIVTDKKKVYVNVGLEGEERTQIQGQLSQGDTVYER